MVFGFGAFDEADAGDDEDDGEDLPPGEPVLAEDVADDGGYYEYPVGVETHYRGRKLLKADIRQQVADGGREEQHECKHEEGSGEDMSGEYRGIPLA